MREAVQNTLAARHGADRRAVVFLVEEKSGFLPLDIVHGVKNPVLGDGCQPVGIGSQTLAAPEAFGCFHALQFSDGGFIPLVQNRDRLPEFFAEQTDENRINLILDLLHAKRQHLGDENVAKPVYRQAGEGVGFAENQAAAGKIALAHDRAAVVDCPTELAFPEGGVKAVVRVFGDDTNADFGIGIVKARAEILALGGTDIGKRAVLGCARDVGHLIGKDPDVTAAQKIRAFLGKGQNRIISHDCPFLWWNNG